MEDFPDTRASSGQALQDWTTLKSKTLISVPVSGPTCHRRSSGASLEFIKTKNNRFFLLWICGLFRKVCSIEAHVWSNTL